MRLIISFNDNDLFVQGEWVDQIGSHTRRLTEDMPPGIKAAAQTLIDWANTEEATSLAPLTEKAGELQRLAQEIGRLRAREAQLGRS
ncbi:hypothetical protein LCGC14_1906990 [marine sediment metagenome]|uniref:Uncharacterized protein n=1 Tax=marine sediment metagenome TaxID=412755 RepID=A0A0F9I8Q4_9ZZZZ